MRTDATLKAARETLASYGVRSLLADPLSNPKVSKNGKLGVLTAPMHLAPANISGFEVCPMRSAGCTAACLNTAGHPAYAKGKAKARNARTIAYFKARPEFMRVLVAEIEAHQRKAERMGMDCAVRLNATSDICWESVPCERAGEMFQNVMAAFPAIDFYDYTKIAKRFHKARPLPSNYSLTFSLAEGNDAAARVVYLAGGNVAAVFNVKRGKPLPETYTIHGETLRVIDGDVHDYRPSDPRGVIVGLRAKGRAIGDASGFVRAVA